MQPKHSSSSRDVFSAQLWKAVGLQPKALSIPRVHFFPEEAASVSCVPSASRGSEDRQGLPCNSTAFVDVHKRRRKGAYSCDDEVTASEPLRAYEASYQAPDLEAMMQAPRRPRTLTSRRPLRDLHRLAAECPLPSMEPEDAMSPAASSGMQQQQQGYDDGELRTTGDAHSTGSPAAALEQQQQQQGTAALCSAQLQPTVGWPSPAHTEVEEQCRAPSPVCQLQLGSSYCEEDQPRIQLVSGHLRKASSPPPGTSPEPPEVRATTKDSPASHSAESSLGVFLDLQERGCEQEGAEHRDGEGAGSASPATSTGQEDQLSKHQHHMAWSRGSPSSEEAD